MVDEIAKAWLNSGQPGTRLLGGSNEISEVDPMHFWIRHGTIMRRMSARPRLLSEAGFEMVSQQEMCCAIRAIYARPDTRIGGSSFRFRAASNRPGQKKSGGRHEQILPA